MKPNVKVFTRANPCTKFDLWKCFRSSSGFRRVPVVEAQSIVGVNSVRVMEREARVERVTIGSTEYYVLTEEGEDWLFQGFARYLKNHPADAGKAKYVPASWGYSKAVRLRRTR